MGGIIAKRVDSIYQPGQRSQAWIKIKNELLLEAAIIGWKPGQGRRQDTVGSPVLAGPDGERFRYVGKVGTGFTNRMLHDLAARLAPTRQDTPPAEVPRAVAWIAVWVTPRFVGGVIYSEMTQHSILRYPRWRGIRDEKTVQSISNT
ncbi:ATP-dependent DNA ligase [Nakamurella sp. UYEF19]|uniref:ATP dependent DNA ligase n=1 Tax=Nakamurella sp. UYEF19 TaxID=1756392 RepID=UPI003393BDBB